MPNTEYIVKGKAPHVRFGTASHRYAGWIGKVYDPKWEDDLTSTSKKLAGKSFQEWKVPVASNEDYFECYDVLELDFTFYNPLITEDGRHSGAWKTLETYLFHSPSDAQFILKVPQSVSAQSFYKRGPNPQYLDVDLMNDRFLAPATELVGDRLAGVLFQQEYIGKRDSKHEGEYIGELDEFFARMIPGVQVHLELRATVYHTEALHAWLVDRGLGFVFSHSSWQKPLHKQWEIAGEQFSAANGDAIVRLLTPLRKKYADAYAMAYPFDERVPELADTPEAEQMIRDTLMFIDKAEVNEKVAHIIVNNRAYGSAPDLIRDIANMM